MLNEVKVVRKTVWMVHPSTIEGAGGMTGQLTHIRVKGVDAYVRESDLRRGNFHVSSNQRWGMKTGIGRASRKHQILELCAPEESWDELAGIIQSRDPLHRLVRRNRQFTHRWAAEQFDRNAPGEAAALPCSTPTAKRSCDHT